MHPSPNIWRSRYAGKYETLNKCEMKECFVMKKIFILKKRVIYGISQISDSIDCRDKRRSMTKKGRQKFSALKWKFFPKKGNSKIRFAINFFRSPKLGAKSPPMYFIQLSNVVTHTKTIILFDNFSFGLNNFVHNMSTSFFIKHFSAFVISVM